MEKRRSEIIVLNEFRYKDTSKIIRVFSRELGKISVLVKGALKAKSNMVSVSQALSHSNAYITKGKNFYYINSANIISSNYKLRSDYKKLIMGSFILELIDKSFLEGEENKKVFDLTTKTLKILQEVECIDALILAYELKFITFLGYKPVLKVFSDYNYFDIESGGIVNNNKKGSGFKVSENDIYYLKKLLYTSLDDIDRFKNNNVLYIQDIILKYIKYNLDIDEFNSLLLL